LAWFGWFRDIIPSRRQVTTSPFGYSRRTSFQELIPDELHISPKPTPHHHHHYHHYININSYFHHTTCTERAHHTTRLFYLLSSSLSSSSRANYLSRNKAQNAPIKTNHCLPFPCLSSPIPLLFGFFCMYSNTKSSAPSCS